MLLTKFLLIALSINALSLHGMQDTPESDFILIAQNAQPKQDPEPTQPTEDQKRTQERRAFLARFATQNAIRNMTIDGITVGLEKKSAQGSTIFHAAMDCNFDEVVQQLLEVIKPTKADIGFTSGRPKIAELLYAKDPSLFTLESAVETDSIAIVRDRLSRGDDITIKIKRNRDERPLITAAQSSEMAQFLIDNGAEWPSSFWLNKDVGWTTLGGWFREHYKQDIANALGL